VVDESFADGLVLYGRTDDHVATITLNRGEKLNGIDHSMIEAIATLWERVKHDDDVHAVVFRAAGERAFSTGLDRKQGFAYPDNLWNKWDPGEKLDPKAIRCWKPVVCAVNGMCAGGAFYIVGGSDIVIASDDATFFDPHVDSGLVAALEPISMSRKMPLGEILRVSLMGVEERMSARRAFEIGLISEIVTRDRLWDRAHQIAAVIASKPTVATQGTVRAVWESLDTGRTQAMARGLSYTQIGNAIGEAEAGNMLKTGVRKPFAIR
jgi:enoyl-CoA hydratase/carnithine racemase